PRRNRSVRRHHVAALSLLHGLSCLAANASQMRFTGDRSLGDFSPDRRDLFAFHARSSPGTVGMGYFRADLGASHFRGPAKTAQRSPAEKAFSLALSRNGLAHSDRNPTARGRGADGNL